MAMQSINVIIRKNAKTSRIKNKSKNKKKNKSNQNTFLKEKKKTPRTYENDGRILRPSFFHQI